MHAGSPSRRQDTSTRLCRGIDRGSKCTGNHASFTQPRQREGPHAGFRLRGRAELALRRPAARRGARKSRDTINLIIKDSLVQGHLTTSNLGPRSRLRQAKALGPATAVFIRVHDQLDYESGQPAGVSFRNQSARATRDLANRPARVPSDYRATRLGLHDDAAELLDPRCRGAAGDESDVDAPVQVGKLIAGSLADGNNPIG
jgi:hypothetical protein